MATDPIVRLWVMRCESCWAVALVIIGEWTWSGMNLEGKKLIHLTSCGRVTGRCEGSYATVKEEIKTKDKFKFWQHNDKIWTVSLSRWLCEWAGCLSSMFQCPLRVRLGQAHFVCEYFAVWEGVNACGLSSPVQGDDRMFMWLLCVCGWVLLCTVWVMGVGCDYRPLMPRTHSTSVWHNNNKPTRADAARPIETYLTRSFIASFMIVHMLMSANSNMRHV